MKNWILLVLFFGLHAGVTFAADLDELKVKIDAAQDEASFLTEKLKHASGSEAENLAYDIYYLLCDAISFRREAYKATATDNSTLNTYLRRLDLAQAELDRAHEQTLDRIRHKIKPEVLVDSLKVAEMKRSYGWVTYSIQLDVENPGPPGKIFVDIKGKRYDGHIVESTILTGILDGDDSATLTDTTMVSDQDALNISRWEVDQIKFYPGQ